MPTDYYDAEYTEVEERSREDGGELPSQTGLIPLPTTAIAAGGSEYASYLQAVMGSAPRDPKLMLAEARRVGTMLGKTAFYKFPVGGKPITGPSIDLAYALAQVWGKCITRCNVIAVEGGDRVRLRGIFFDLLTCAICERDYVAHLAPASGGFAKNKEQSERWRVMQEQNAISKAVRGAILGGLPAWFVDEAMSAALAEDSRRQTGGKPLAEARVDLVAWFERGVIKRPELEAYVGMGMEMWAVDELGQLRELAEDLKAGRTSVERFRAEIAEIQGAGRPTTGAASLGAKGGRPAEPKPTEAAKPTPKPEDKPSEPAKPAEKPADAKPKTAATDDGSP